MPVLLESDTPGWSIPNVFYNQIAALIPSLNASTGNVPCSTAQDNMTFQLTFADNIPISVPLSNFIVPTYTNDVQNVDSAGNPLCTFLIYASGDNSGLYALGSAILQSMYTVFDLDAGQVGIAQAATKRASAGDIYTVVAGPDSQPSAVAGPDFVFDDDSDTVTIAGAVSATVAVSASTLGSAIGTATGSAAVPLAGLPVSGTSMETETKTSTQTETPSQVLFSTETHPTRTSPSASPATTKGGTSSASASSTKKGAASGLSVPLVGWTVGWMSGITVLGLGLGAVVIL